MQQYDATAASGKPLVRPEVDELLRQTAAYHQVDAATQLALAESMSRIVDYLTDNAGASGLGTTPLAGALAPPNLRAQLGPHAITPGPPPATAGPSSPGQTAQPASGSGSSATGRVGEVARATLNAIDFPSFVGSLIHGTFQAIVDSSIQQMEAYAELLKNVTRSVDQFMSDNISDGTARDYLADRYPSVLSRDTSDGKPRLVANGDGSRNGEMPSFFKDLGYESADAIDDEAVEQTLVPAARRSLAEQRQQTLATMVMMGINRVLIEDGEITAKLQFHIDASESTTLRFDQTKQTGGNMSGRGGRSPFTANAIMVNTTSLNAQSEINVRADLVGQVKVRFRSDAFPLERFADSAAIQLINHNAKVPPPVSSGPPTSAAAPAPPAAPPAAPPPPAALPPLAAPQPAARPAATPPPAPSAGAQGLGADPWAPRS